MHYVFVFLFSYYCFHITVFILLFSYYCFRIFYFCCLRFISSLAAKEILPDNGVDMDGAVSPIFEVAIRISENCHNGSPNFTTLAVGGVVSPSFSIYECQCDAGWTGTSIYRLYHS